MAGKSCLDIFLPPTVTFEPQAAIMPKRKQWVNNLAAHLVQGSQGRGYFLIRLALTTIMRPHLVRIVKWVYVGRYWRRAIVWVWSTPRSRLEWGWRNSQLLSWTTSSRGSWSILTQTAVCAGIRNGHQRYRILFTFLEGKENNLNGFQNHGSKSVIRYLTLICFHSNELTVKVIKLEKSICLACLPEYDLQALCVKTTKYLVAKCLCNTIGKKTSHCKRENMRKWSNLFILLHMRSRGSNHIDGLLFFKHKCCRLMYVYEVLSSSSK